MTAAARGLAAAVMLAAILPVAHAADIQFSATPLGGSTWRYDYVVTNDDLPALDQFSIFFEAGTFANLAVSASPAGWSSIALQPTATGGGLFDSLALDASLAQGASQGGFSVTFTYLAAGTPGSQAFAIIDPFEGPVLQEGMTRPIPEPETLALLLAGMVPVAAWARRRREPARSVNRP